MTPSRKTAILVKLANPYSSSRPPGYDPNRGKSMEEGVGRLKKYLGRAGEWWGEEAARRLKPRKGDGPLKTAVGPSSRRVQTFKKVKKPVLLARRK